MKFRERILRRLADFVYLQYPTIIVVSILLTIISLAISGLFLTTKTGRIDLISENNPACKRFFDLLDDFGSPDDLVILVQGGDPSVRKQAVKKLALNLEKKVWLVDRVFYRIPIEFFEERGLQYADKETLKKVLSAIQGINILLEDTKGELGLVPLFEKVDKTIEKSIRKRQKISDKDKVGLDWLRQMLLALNRSLENPNAKLEDSIFQEFRKKKRRQPHP